MPNFTPSGIIHIGSVPFDDSYAHTVMAWGSASEQYSAMLSRMETALSESTYTYVRMNNAIRVKGNAESLYTHNYVMYQNANYGSKWFYAFIIAINYINENCTELVLSLDVIQTWWFELVLGSCMVEREHVASDVIGEHLNPEPEFGFSSVIKDRYTEDRLNDCYVIVQTCALPRYWEVGGSDVVVGTISQEGGWYDNIYSGGKYLAYDATDSGEKYLTLSGFLHDMNEGGGAEAITSIFMFPKILTPARGEGREVSRGTNPHFITSHIARPSSLDGGYVPRNNKLFTYPYCYCMVDDNAGHSATYRYEFFAAEDDAAFTVTSSIDPDSTCFVMPWQYDGTSAENVTEAFGFALCPHCSWVYNSYASWLAQNGVKNALSAGLNIAMFAWPAGKGIASAGKAISTGGKAFKEAKAVGFGMKESLQYGSIVGRDAKRGLSTAEKASMATGAYGASQLAGEVAYQSMQPNVQRGSNSGNTLYANGYMTYNLSQVVIREEWARIMDGFLDMYGYQVDSVKVPNVTGRPSWNYVKTQNACHHGAIPAEDLTAINTIFDGGITFWHTWDVGNYGLDNTI